MSIIGASIGILADIIFLIIYFTIPLVKYALALNFIMLSIIWNALQSSSTIILIIFLSNNETICYIIKIIISICYLSQINLTIIYIFYIFKIVYKNTPKDSLSIKNYLIYESLFKLFIISLYVISDIIQYENESKYISYLYLPITSALYLALVIACFVMSFKIYLGLKYKYVLNKTRAFKDFLRLISFPFIVLIILCCDGILIYLKTEDSAMQSIFYFIINITGLFLLICLIATEEMKDGLKILRMRSKKLLNIELK